MSKLPKAYVSRHMRQFTIQLRLEGKRATNLKSMASVGRLVTSTAKMLAEVTGGNAVCFSDDFFKGHEDLSK